MRQLLGSVMVAAGLIIGSVGVAAAVEKDPCGQRVPADQVAAAKGMKNPVANSPAAVAEGKAVFEGKGTCFTCHGMAGKGDGDAGKALDPTPRNLTNPQFQDCKSDGELFWVIKNGSAGTGMIPAVTTGIISEDEAWKAILFIRSLKGK